MTKNTDHGTCSLRVRRSLGRTGVCRCLPRLLFAAQKPSLKSSCQFLGPQAAHHAGHSHDKYSATQPYDDDQRTKDEIPAAAMPNFDIRERRSTFVRPSHTNSRLDDPCLPEPHFSVPPRQPSGVSSPSLLPIVARTAQRGPSWFFEAFAVVLIFEATSAYRPSPHPFKVEESSAEQT